MCPVRRRVTTPDCVLLQDSSLDLAVGLQPEINFPDCLRMWKRPIKMVKVKVTLLQALRLCTGRTAHRGSRGIAILFHDHGTRRGWGVSFTCRPFLPPGKTRYPLYRRVGEPQGRSGQVRKISPPPGFNPRTVQPVASRYTDYATRLNHRSGRQPKTYVKPEAAITVFELLMMGGVSPETCWAIKKIGIINSTTRLHLVGSSYEFFFFTNSFLHC